MAYSNKPSMIPFLQYSEKKLRKIPQGYFMRGDNDNKSTIRKRRRNSCFAFERAKLLGYDNHASLF